AEVDTRRAALAMESGDRTGARRERPCGDRGKRIDDNSAGRAAVTGNTAVTRDRLAATPCYEVAMP
ncbi:MAG: hypothetical protein ACRDTZ_20765, partial [Pseudonocardiaceae bacterium]